MKSPELKNLVTDCQALTTLYGKIKSTTKKKRREIYEGQTVWMIDLPAKKSDGSLALWYENWPCVT